MFKMNKGLTPKGRLLDENGKAVADQWVHVRQIRDRNARHKILSSVATTIGRFAKTDGDGYVTFAPLPRGKYNVEPSEGDYTPFSGVRYESTPIRGVFPLQTNVAPILLVKPMDTDGNLLKSVKVSGQYADTSNPERIRFETQKDGRQRSKQLLPDEKCTITVTAPGHRPQSRTISLAEGTTSELTLKLEPR